MHLISGEFKEHVLISALHHLVNSEQNLEYNFILQITKPSKTDKAADKIRLRFDDLLAGAGLYSVNTVAETIFPSFLYKKEKLDGVYTTYPEIVYPEIKKSPGNAKGTYAYRLVRGLGAKGKVINPLELVINRLKIQVKNSAIRCAFELSMEHGNVDDIPDSYPDSVSINQNDNFTRGFPCLSHLSFKLSHNRDQLLLTALYRSHDYVQKLLGNLYGLARLQAAVAKELGIDVGDLVIHSTLARLDTHNGLGKAKIKKFLEETIS